MTIKNVASFLVIVIAYVAIVSVLRTGHVCDSYVHQQVEAGYVAEVTAPRVALFAEVIVAMIGAMILASSNFGKRIGNWIESGLTWLYAKWKAANGGTPPAGSPTSEPIDINQLKRVLRDVRARITALEKAAFGVKPDGSPADPSGTSAEPATAEVTVSVSQEDLNDQTKKAIAEAVAEALAAQSATRRSRSSKSA